ncbi:MAG: chemotaxis protein CheW [Gammaproteobacteria bacterium]|nr:chemotaxis protein CheW [Gammaproteobacteria bacterium]
MSDTSIATEGNGGQYLSFSLGGEDYGVDILRVQEIRGWEELRLLPDTPDYVKGVLDLRGTIVPIIDLRIRMNMSKVEYHPTTVIIVLSVSRENGEKQFVGAVVDAVSDVLDVSEKEIRKAPEIGTKINDRYMRGMVSRDERMVVLLDVDQLFKANELGLLDNLS